MQHIAEHCSLHATKINVIGLIGGTFVNPNLSFCWVFTHIRIKIVQRNGREDGNMNFWDHFELLSHNHVANKPGKWPTGGGLPWCDQTWAKHVWFVVLKFDVSDIGFLSQCSASFLVCLELYSELASSPVCMMKIDYPYLLMVSIHWLSIVSWNSWNSLACSATHSSPQLSPIMATPFPVAIANSDTQQQQGLPRHLKQHIDCSKTGSRLNSFLCQGKWGCTPSGF